jgi:hypothetical protein
MFKSFRDFIAANPIFCLGILVAFEQAVSHGTLQLTSAIPHTWIPAVTAWCTILAFIGNLVMTGLAAPGFSKPPTAAIAKVFAWLIVPLALVMLLGGPAGAQGPTPRARPSLTGDIPADIKNAVNPTAASTQSGGLFGHEKTVNNAPCDFNFFTALKAENLLDQINLCVSAQLVEDTKAALDSATASKDQVGVTCLTPGLAILQAARSAMAPPPAPTPAAADAPPAAAPGADSAPTKNPRLILLFQKWREFGIAGGPSACKSWVQTTITMNNPILQ